MLDADLSKLTRLHFKERPLELWDERAEEVDLAALRDEDNDCDVSPRHGLLVLQLLVDGDEDVECRLRQSEQLAVLLPGPAHLRYRPNLMVREVLP